MPPLVDRQGRVIPQKAAQDRLLAFLYRHAAGRALLRLLLWPPFSRLGGALLSTRLSALAVPAFVRAHGLDMTQFENRPWRSFNDFFTRRLAPGARRVCGAPSAFVSPCDARLTVWPLDGRTVTVKQTPYTLERLLHNRPLARQLAGGWVWVFRLCPQDYHRYIWPDDGQPAAGAQISGVLHTVRPAACDAVPVYAENCRQYCLLDSAHFGRLVLMEVGALLVGRIENQPLSGAVRRGQEKGHFAFGGSTILVFCPPGVVRPDADILQNSRRGLETRVLLGEKVGTALQTP